MDDLISREFMKSLGATCIAARREGDGELIALGGIDMLPSAQPEIVRCEDCKWWTKQEASLQGRCALSGSYPTGRWYCANAKKKGDPNE